MLVKKMESSKAMFRNVIIKGIDNIFNAVSRSTDRENLTMWLEIKLHLRKWRI